MSEENEMRWGQSAMKAMFNLKEKYRIELAEAKERENQFWGCLQESYDIESREELEELAKGWEPRNSLLVALHHIWKREPIVIEKDKQLEAMRELKDSYKEYSEFLSEVLGKYGGFLKAHNIHPDKLDISKGKTLRDKIELLQKEG